MFRRISTVFTLAAALAVIFTQNTAQAAILTLDAVQDLSEVSSFTFDFPDFGFQSGAQITQTNYQLAIDPAGAPDTSAYFLNYHQLVDPIFLPTQTGFVSTGDLTITIEQSISGTYDDLTGIVTTTDLYRIEFTGDLSDLGFESPVFLPGTSSGVVNFNPDGLTGTVDLAWDGNVQLPPASPELPPTNLNYTCATYTTFVVVPEPASLAFLGMGVIGLVVRRRR